MINQIMDFCNNHFVRTLERDYYNIVSDGITGTFNETYIVGQYVWIRATIVNDGVYKITGVTSNKITLDATLTEETSNDLVTFYGLAVPNAFLSIVSDIETWITSNGGNEGIASESIDAYSVSFGTGADGQTSNTWTSAFSGRLKPYKQVYETPEFPIKSRCNNGYRKIL